MALIATVGLLGTRILFFSVAGARHIDGAIMVAFIRVGSERVWRAAHSLTQAADLTPVAIACAALVGVAAVRGRYRAAGMVGISVLASNMATELLKSSVAPPRQLIPAASWPSGHATAVMSLALGAVIVAPLGGRLLIASIGAVVSTAMGYALLKLQSHYMSDVLAGYLVAAATTAVVLAGALTFEARRPVGSKPVPIRRYLSYVTWACLLEAALLCGLLFHAPHSALAGINNPPLLAAGALAIGVASVAIIGAFAMVLVPDGAAPG